MKKTGLFGVLLLLVCLLAGCQEENKKETWEYSMFYLSPKEEKLVEDEYIPEKRTTSDMVDEIAEKLMEPIFLP